MTEYQAPFVEDASDGDSDSGVVISPMSPSQSQANVAPTGSHPSDLGADKTPILETVASSNRSDSGYSSFTAATMNSADSAPSAKAQGPPAPISAVPMPPPSPATRTKTKRRSTIVDQPPMQSSPRKPLGRTNSVSRASSTRPPPRERRAPPPPTEDCTDPNCTTCGPNARSRGPRPSPLDSALELAYPPSDTRSQRSDPIHSYTAPPSATYTRQQPSYMQGPALVQPAVSRARRSSTTTRARPVSYHGTPGQEFHVPGLPVGYPSPPQDYGPPPAMSASYAAMHQPQPRPGAMAPYAMMGSTPPNNYFPSGHPMHPPMHSNPLFEAQQPQMQSRQSSNYNARGPHNNYGPALITQDQNNTNMPSARYALPSARQERIQQTQFESESSEEESSEEEVDYRRALVPLPPPPPPPPKTRTPREPRPGLPHAHTTQVYPSNRRLSQSLVLERPRPRDREPKVSRVHTVPPSRSNSISRPAIRHPKAESARETSRVPTRVVVEDPRAQRRQSHLREYHVDRPRSKVYHEEPAPRPVQRRRPSDESDEEEYDMDSRRHSKTYRDEPRAYRDDSEREYREDFSREYREDPPREYREDRSKVHRDEPRAYRGDPPKVYRDDHPSRASRDQSVAKLAHRRRPTDTDSQSHDDYISRQEKLRDTTNDIEAYMQQTRGSDMPLNDQVHKAAKRASRVPLDARTRNSDERSQSNRTTMTNGASGEIRLRIDASAPLSLSFNGDMEGRTLQINPAEDGMAELVIANPRGNENTYRSERGSVFGGRKLIAATPRRDAEETRSTRSSRTVREGSARAVERRPLRRKGDI